MVDAISPKIVLLNFNISKSIGPSILMVSEQDCAYYLILLN